MAVLISKWANTLVQLTDSLASPAWADAGTMPIQGGVLYVKNDAQFLYVALDMVEDTSNDPTATLGDYFWFTFDRDRNGAIGANFDVNYGLYPGFSDKMGRQYYLGGGTWTGLVNEVSQSACKVAFEASPNSGAAHKIWKMRFLITDLNVAFVPWLLPYTRFGIKVHSHNPSFDYETPAGFYYNFTNLHYLVFSRQPVINPALLGPVIGSVGLIPTTKIDGTTGKATTDPGYFIYTQDAAFGSTLNLIANRVTLQGLYNAGARKCRVFQREGTSGAFLPLRSFWFNYLWNGTTYVQEAFAPDANDMYTVLNPALDYSIDDLLIQFDSNTLLKGIHQFQIQFFTAANVFIPSTAQTVTLFIDNFAPAVKINAIRHGGRNVDACDMVNLTDAKDGLTFDITANDPEGNMQAYSFSANWRNGQSESIVSDSYTPAKGVNWGGVVNLVTPSSGEWIPDETCAYSFSLQAWSRSTNGYNYIGYNSVSKFVTIIMPSGVGAAATKTVMARGQKKGQIQV
jgi:hypothetical protein